MKKKFEITSTVILGVLIVITLIVIMLSKVLLGTYSSLDTSVFLDRVDNIYKKVNSMDNDVTFYSDNENILDTEYKDLKYCIILDDKGKINHISIGNDKYYLETGNKFSKDNKIIYESYPYTTCNKIMYEKETNCTSNINIVDGSVYRNNNFEYKYNYELNLVNDELVWEHNSDLNGWGVRLLENADTMKVCSMINNKEVVSMKYLFYSHMFESDFSNFDTRNVKDMSYMFYYYHGNKQLNLNSFDTRKVENMSYMFNTTGIKELDIRSFVINDDTLVNGILSNNRILTKVILKDEKQINKIKKNNGMYDRLNFSISE